MLIDFKVLIFDAVNCYVFKILLKNFTFAWDRYFQNINFLNKVF